MAEVEEESAWDNFTPERFGFDADAAEDFIATSSRCFMARLRQDGHPVGAYYGCAHHAGDVYIFTNVFRKAYAAIKRDPRITVVFVKEDVGEVTIIGRGEIIDDYDLVRQFFLRIAETNHWVVSGAMTVDHFMKTSCSTNRRLIKVHKERIFSLEMAKLPMEEE